MTDPLIKAIVNMDNDEAIRIVNKRIASNEDPMSILDCSKEALTTIGELFETGEFFLAELVMGGQIFKEIADIVSPLLKSEVAESEGRILIGTVQNDIHDLGKNIVVLMLEISGFDVLDIGVDQPAENFIKAIKEFDPQVIGLSGLLTVAFTSMQKIVAEIENAGLREGRKIMIGGSQMDDHVNKFVGADAFGTDAMKAVELSSNWCKG